MRKLALFLFGRLLNRIGRFVFPRRRPVPLEHGHQAVHDRGIVHVYGDFPPQVECRRIEVLRTEKRPLAVDDDKLGTIEKGKLADLVVLSDDPLTVSDDRLRKISSVLTLQAGKIVHNASIRPRGRN